MTKCYHRNPKESSTFHQISELDGSGRRGSKGNRHLSVTSRAFNIDAILWSLSNAFTSAFKQLEPIPQLRATRLARGIPGAAMTVPARTNRGHTGSAR